MHSTVLTTTKKFIFVGLWRHNTWCHRKNKAYLQIFSDENFGRKRNQNSPFFDFSFFAYSA